jgi:hypothetical protein
VKNFPDQPAKAVGNGPDRFGVSHPGRQASENNLKLAIFLSNRGVSELIEKPTHGAVTFGRAVAA